MKNSFLILTAIALIVFSCSKEAKDKSENCLSKPTLTGTWKWVRSDGGIANNIHETPASTGKNINIALNNDLRYFIYTNGILTSQGTYNFITQNCIHDNTNKKVIDFSSPNDRDMMIENMDHQTLNLSDNVFDGVRSLYLKE